MSVKARVFLFISFLFITLVCFNTQPSNALRKENNSSDAKVQASPTPKPKSNKPRKQRTRRKSSEQFMREPPRANLTTSSNIVYLPCDDGNYASECVNSNNQVLSISANATDPDGDTLLYTYDVSVGKIIGTGGNVQWDLSGVPEGKYEIALKVDYKNYGVIQLKKEIEVVKCKCKLIQTPFDSFSESDKAVNKSPFTFMGIDKKFTFIGIDNNKPHEFGVGVLGIPNSRKQVAISNHAPSLDSRLSSLNINLPCDYEKSSDERNFLIDVFANAIDPDGDTLLYTYDVSVGKIIGSGPNVKWDLSGVPSGKHKITAQVDDGKGAVTEQVLELEVIRYGCSQTR